MPVTTYPIYGKTIPFTIQEIYKQDIKKFILEQRNKTIEIENKEIEEYLKHDDKRSFIQDSWGTLIEDPIPSSIHIPAITKW